MSSSTTIVCKAAVAREAGKPLVIEEVKVEAPKAHEVRIKILCTSLCHSDLIFWNLQEPYGHFPRILGHEAVGFSQYTVVDVAHLTKVDPQIPPNRACLLSCGVSTGIGAAWKTAQVDEGSTVVVFGLGAIGLVVAEGARICGAAKIIGVDINPAKFEIEKKFGITDFVNPTNIAPKSISEVIKEMTDGGADYCFECVGMTTLVEEAYSCCRKGWGKTVVLGVDKPESKLSISSNDVLCNGNILTGSIFGGLKAKSDISTLVGWYFDKKLQLDEFVTQEMKLEDINTAFELLQQGNCVRCVMWMDDMMNEE